jgi:hypothetical protein
MKTPWTGTVGLGTDYRSLTFLSVSINNVFDSFLLSFEECMFQCLSHNTISLYDPDDTKH